MARVGGNPDLVKYQFKNKGTEPLSKKMCVSFTEKMHKEIKERGGSEFARAAIAKAIKESFELKDKDA